MNPQTGKIAAAGLALFAHIATTSSFAVGGGSAVSNERQHELIHLIKHDCGSCHGLTLQGGLGPALTPQALQDRVPSYLARVINEGRSGTAMPPWRELLTAAEVDWIVQRLLQGIAQND